MHVVATAGHVDHGKSTLVRALTGMEPDRWAEERRRGMTIDLGYAWTVLPGRSDLLAFVDVPGHQRFIANMLAGLGPVPAVLFVVAADEGWRRQSGEHLAAIDALGVTSGLLVITRSDLADPAPAMAAAREQLANSSLGVTEAVAVSATTGAGLEALRSALGRLLDELPPPVTDGRVRLWVDRSFSVRGAGTVVTGTLPAGTLRIGDELEAGGRLVRVRDLEQAGAASTSLTAVARAGINLRGVTRDQIGRGDVLLTPGAWRRTSGIDVRLTVDARTLASELVLHVGTAAVPVHVRPLDARVARLTLRSAQPLVVGDRAVLRNPGLQTIAAGVEVLDAQPPPLRRRGAAAARADALAEDLADGGPRLDREVLRRGAVQLSELQAAGVFTGEQPERVPGVRRVGDWFVSDDQWQDWTQRLLLAVDARRRAEPLDPGLSARAAQQSTGLPSTELLAPLIASAGLHSRGGQVLRPGVIATMGPAEAGLREIENRLAANPFAAPERAELLQLGLGNREIAVAVALTRLLRISDDVCLLPSAPAQAMRLLADLPQPFTTSEARQALGTTRRVVIPLLEHLDERGWTERIDGAHRRVRR
jgi:selenocysteine-specific elongation factor